MHLYVSVYIGEVILNMYWEHLNANVLVQEVNRITKEKEGFGRFSNFDRYW